MPLELSLSSYADFDWPERREAVCSHYASGSRGDSSKETCVSDAFVPVLECAHESFAAGHRRDIEQSLSRTKVRKRKRGLRRGKDVDVVEGRCEPNGRL